jgi:Domain of unknown function (DUF5658)
VLAISPSVVRIERTAFLESDMRRLVVLAFSIVLLASAPVAADENADPTPIAMARASATETVPGIGGRAVSAPRVSFTERSFDRPSALRPLYAASVALQAWDAYSTLAGLKRGGVELNPVMAPATKNTAVFVALKGAVAAAAIFQAERMWRDHHRVRAVAFMAVSNAVMAVVAANNQATLRRLQ